MRMKSACKIALCAWLIILVVPIQSRLNAEPLEVRDPLQYQSQLSAPTGYDPLQDYPQKQGRVPRRYIVRMKRGVTDLDGAISSLLSNTTVSTAAPQAGAVTDGSINVAAASLAAVGATPRSKYEGGGVKGFILDLPSDVDEIEAVSKLSAHQDVIRVVPDTWVGIAAATVRLSSGSEATTSLYRVGAILTPKSRATSARPMGQKPSNGSVVVGLIDTGCDVTNTDLNIIGGMDFTSDNSYGMDGNGHGTHVAGILGSKGNAAGIVGMFPNVGIYCLKVLGASGQGTMGTVVTALTWVAQNGRANKIRVINLSLSGETNSEVCDAITAVTKQGITVVVAAGNNGQDIAEFSPGNCPDALVVAAMTDLDGLPGGIKGVDPSTGETDDTPARFSNYFAAGRPSNIIAAPGVRILSYFPAYKCLDPSSACIPGTPNLAYLSGTSMAAPMATGQVAMCYERGTCKSSTMTELSKVVRTAYNHTARNREFGFNGDPINKPVVGKYYGYLVYGNAY